MNYMRRLFLRSSVIIVFISIALNLSMVRWEPWGSFVGAGDTGWKSIFDGKSLNGWKAPDMSVWSVEDEAITGTVTPEHRATGECLHCLARRRSGRL